MRKSVVFSLLVSFLCVFRNQYALSTEIFFDPAHIMIETERLVLRLIDPIDAQDIFVFTSDPEVGRFTEMFALHRDCEETQAFIERYLDGYKKHIVTPWAVVCKADNKVVGIIDLFYNHENHKAELGYAFSRNILGPWYCD